LSLQEADLSEELLLKARLSKTAIGLKHQSSPSSNLGAMMLVSGSTTLYARYLPLSKNILLKTKEEPHLPIGSGMCQNAGRLLSEKAKLVRKILIRKKLTPASQQKPSQL
jgi:hypothetical protein